MINIEELLYDIDLKLNKIGSNEHQNFELENKIIALNDAHINVIKTKFSENNLYQAGLDSFQKRYNDLEILIETNQSLIPKKIKDPLNKWEVDLNKLKINYMLTVPHSEYILADKGSCKDNLITLNLVKHSDIKQCLNNTNTKPSFEYQETIGAISNHKYEIFTDGSFIPTKFVLSYVRYPKKVDFPGYTHFNGSESKKVDSELPYYLKDEIVDVAVKNLAMSSENTQAAQASEIRLKNGE